MDISIFENQFEDIEFDDETHSYKVKDATDTLISVTTLIHKYSQPFDSDKIASRVAKDRNVDKDELLKSWQDKGESSANKGKHLHKFIEEYCKHQQEFKMDLYSEEKAQFIKFYQDFLSDKVVIYLEKILYLRSANLAGTIDCLVYCPINDILYFIDWKSNEKISTYNKFQKLKPPLSRYEQCSKEIYTIQLSLYRYIIEEVILNKSQGFSSKTQVKNLLIHFSKLNESYVIMELPYYKYSTIELLKHYNNLKGI